MFLLSIEHSPQQAFDFEIGRIGELHIGIGSAHGAVAQVNKAPTFRHVHCNLSGRTPCPVVLREIFARSIFLAQIFAVHQFVLPLNARETDAQIVAGFQIVVETLSDGFARDGKFNGPSLVGILRVVERAVHLSCHLHSRAIPLELHESGRRSAIRLLDSEVEDCADGICFDFEIVVSVAIGVDENFEVVVIINHFVVGLDVSPNVRVVEFGSHIKIFVVPKHFRLSVIAWCRETFAADVDKSAHRGSVLPRLLIELAVDSDFVGSAIAHIVVRDGQKPCELLGNWLRLSSHSHDEGSTHKK